MKLILKNLKQKQFNIEVESEKSTVKDLKLAIEKAHGFDSSLIKLLHNGRVLEDSKTLEEYEIKEEHVVVIMNTKPKQATPAEKVEQKKEETAKPLEPPQPSQPSPPSQPEPKPEPQVNSESVDALVEMGYEKEKVIAALKASHGSVDLAIEYLSSGNIPEPKENNANQGGQSVPSASNSTGATGNVSELKKHAAIMKVICAKEPSRIFMILNRMKETEPQLVELIKQNEQEFKNLLVAPITREDIEIFREYGQRLAGGRGAGPREIAIRLTKEEAEAIKRLKELGNFSQEEVLQAYIACDKDEAATANYLFEQRMREDNENNNNNQ